MESEELRLLRENNLLLKQICQMLAEKDNNIKEFLINLMANLVSENMVRH